VTGKGPVPCEGSQRVHCGEVRGPLITVRLTLTLTLFSKCAICIECAPPCTGAKNSLKYITLQ
ncbi:hypothetical protein, partial [Sansalvadorimonas verongulae]|uniref:hypothetical protein n=1 Tax=Sansalvadorimonas verongulae TaxID=2172824 RepID=UPI001E5A17EC